MVLDKRFALSIFLGCKYSFIFYLTNTSFMPKNDLLLLFFMDVFVA